MRVVDYIAEFIYTQLDVPKVFLMTGGGAMFLNDGIASHPKLEAVCNHHEQACSMSAVGYAKYRNGFSAAMFTSGCGSTNAMTGLLDAWQDNTKCFFLSGQVKQKETVRKSGLALRQIGVQEADIVAIVEPITKYAVMVTDPNEIAYHLEKAKFLAETGRPGPVWVDVPMDVQGAPIDEASLKHFDESEYMKEYNEVPKDGDVVDIVKLLESAERPIVIVGNGVRLAEAEDDFKEFIEKNNIPVVASYLSLDILSNDHPNYLGTVGLKADRAANFAMQNSDLIVAIGSRLAVGLTGFEYSLFGRNSKIAVIDIDPIEHQKNTVRIDLFVNSDAKLMLQELNSKEIKMNIDDEWHSKYSKWRDMWSVSTSPYENGEGTINIYTFIQHLNKNMKADSAVVSDAGSNYYVTPQTIRPKGEQRYITSSAQGDMGYTMPAAIGVSVARDGGEVFAITGDGSFQLNVQELQTMVHYNLPVKLFVLNNDGYLSIRATQRKFFEGRFIGTDDQCGVSFPKIEKIADAYAVKYFKVSDVDKLDDVMAEIMKIDGPVLCEVMCPRDQEVVPAVSSIKRDDGTMVSKPLEDMYPFLERDVFNKEMIISPMEE